eukprot:gene20523-22542_t
MLRFIAQKLRNQSLNEVRPIENQVNSWLFEDVEELETCGTEKGKDKKPCLNNERDYGNAWNNNYPYSNVGEEQALATPPIDSQLKELTLKDLPDNAILFPVLPTSRIGVTPDNAVDIKDQNRNASTNDSISNNNSSSSSGKDVFNGKENQPCFMPLVVKSPRPSIVDQSSSSSPRGGGRKWAGRKLSDVKRRKADMSSSSSSESSSSDDEIKELCSYGVTLLKRQRSRIVRVRALSNSRSCDVAALGFKPITNLNPCINHLAPVENPIAF